MGAVHSSVLTQKVVTVNNTVPYIQNTYRINFKCPYNKEKTDNLKILK